MKTDKRTQLLKILSDASQSISSAALANMLGTSERTVRNYIKAINEEGKAVITSSREGYRLESHTASLDTLPNEAESRVWKVLSDLLTSKEGVNAFDEAEALYVSSSTILNTVIPQVKEIAKEYDLRIESQKYQFYLRGSEQNRRKMIGSLAVRNTYGFFNSKDALEQLFPSQDIDGIMQELFTTCQESKLFLNDFALNNLLIHILVILIRLNIGNELDDKEPPISVDELLASSQDREDIVNLADMISANFEQKYSIRIPERDYKQILMLIALSVEHETVDIQCVISPEFIHNVASILSMMSQRYCTPEFDNDYILQFSLHMYYAQQRCAFHISYPNPIALQFKKDYAPVYDMAVYFAHRFARSERGRDRIHCVSHWFLSGEQQAEPGTRHLCSDCGVLPYAGTAADPRDQCCFCQPDHRKGSSAPEPVPQPSAGMRPCADNPAAGHTASACGADQPDPD